MHDDKKYQFLANLTSLQNGAPEFIEINFFTSFTSLLDSVDKIEPRTDSSQ